MAAKMLTPFLCLCFLMVWCIGFVNSQQQFGDKDSRFKGKTWTLILSDRENDDWEGSREYE